MNNNKTIQIISLGDEVRLSIRLLQLGIRELQQISMANDFYFSAFRLLADGFERFLKCILCYQTYDNENNFPDFKKLKGFGHNLKEKKNKVLDCIDTSKLRDNSGDYEYMKNDADLNKLLELLSKFGDKSRYYNLDLVTNREPKPDNIEQLWQQYELSLISLDRIKGTSDESIYKDINTQIIFRLEKFARALSRLFSFGCLGTEAKKVTGYLTSYLFLTDDKLGAFE